VLHQIGIGALGPVFRTYEPTRDRLVAVKVFRLDIVPEQAQALAEALTRATQASLFHPSIVSPIAAGVEGTVAYRAEEYVAAESLDVAMRHYAPAPLDKALPFITQLGGAIDFARAAGVGHGALHPRDIFVTPDEARATGFGVVEALEQVGIRAPVRRPYSAPERIDGGQWSTPADIFALAAIAFELLTGRRPSGTGEEIGALPDGPASSAVHAVLARAMAEEPSKRFATALAFAGALEAAGRGEAAPAPEPVAPVVAAPLILAPAVVPTRGEFEIEKDLDPVHAAPADDLVTGRDLDEADFVERVERVEPADRTLFDVAHDSNDLDDDELGVRGRAGAGGERFADEFVDEQVAEAENRRPLEAVHETIVPVPYAAEDRMFAAADPEPDPDPELRDSDERSRPAVLPMAVTLMLGLLIGFGAAYFMISRERNATPQTETATDTAVPPSAAATPPAAAPPVPNETATPAATRGRLVVTSIPNRAGVTLNGNWRGRTPLTLDNLPLGRYVVRVVQPGYRVERRDVSLSASDASHEFAAQLTRTAATPAPASRGTSPKPSAKPVPETFTGTLFVDSRPRGATVFLDDRSIGKTPLSLPDVSIGTHIVRLELAGKKPWTTTTRIVAGQTARVTGSLEDQ
jgi:hypothetical protein